MWRNLGLMAFAVTVALAPVAAENATDYNVVVRNNFTAPSSDIEGRLAAGGNVTVSSYSVGEKLTNADNGRYTIVAGNKITIGNTNGGGGSVHHGHMLAKSYELHNFGFLDGGQAYTYADSPRPQELDIGAEMNRLTALSGALAANPASFGTVGSVTWQYDQFFLYGADTSVNIFNLDGAKFGSNYGWHLVIPVGSVAIFNVGGSSVSIANTGSDNKSDWLPGAPGFAVQAYDPTRVLYNFYQATSLSLAVAEATVLAPNADVTGASGVINGQLFANSFTGTTQVNLRPFDSPLLDPPASVPEPATWAQLMLGFAMLGSVLRLSRARRRRQQTTAIQG